MAQCQDIISPGMVSWWCAEGNTADSIGTNSLVANGNLSYAPGESGYAFSFDGNSAYLQMSPPSVDLGDNGTGLTIELWIDPSSATNGSPLAEWDSTDGFSGIGTQFWASGGDTDQNIGGPGCLYVNLIDQYGQWHPFGTATGLVNANTFQHVALTYDKASGVGTIYYNGTVVASQNLGSFTPSTPSSYNLYIGARFYYGTTLYSGLMDEIGLYNRALTGAEIQTLFQQGAARKFCVAPQILTQPQNASVTAGANATFTASAYGSQPLYFQWQENGTNLLGATNGTLTLTNVQTGDEGVFSVIVTNAQGMVSSTNAELNVVAVAMFGNGEPLTNAQYNFSGTVTIQMQNYYPGGDIFYTLDGSEPTPFSQSYTGPFQLTNNAVIRALAYSSDFSESGTAGPVTIVFPPHFTLTATTAGGGSISLSPTNSSYFSNTVVNLTAVPSNGWVFLEWLGDTAGTNPTTSVLMSRSKSVQALFGTAVTSSVTGGGSVQFNPPGGIYPYGTVLQVSAVPQPGQIFALWGSAASGSTNPLTYTVVSNNAKISALFTASPNGKAAIAAVPVGEGQVSVNPSAPVYNVNQLVTLTATPNAGKTFLGWSGDASGTNNPLSVTLTTNKTIYANFSLNKSLSMVFGPGVGTSEGVELNLSGEMGTHYRLDASSDLVNWTPLFDLTNYAGMLHYIDTNAANENLQFYRAVILP